VLFLFEKRSFKVCLEKHAVFGVGTLGLEKIFTGCFYLKLLPVPKGKAGRGNGMSSLKAYEMGVKCFRR
jgi:hypothetical protein